MSGRWIASRVLVGFVLAVWAAVFWYLLLTGRSSLYLSKRVEWVVPVGAILLTVIALGRLLTARGGGEEGAVSRRYTLGLSAVVLPAAALLVLPPQTLGSFAASQQSLANGYSAGSADLESGEVTLAAVAAAMWSKDSQKMLAERAGTEVSFVGFVDRREGMPADEFMLTRFLVSCCVADALGVSVRVVGAPPGKFQPDQWVRVTGAFYSLGKESIVDASGIEAVPRPEDPYLSV